MFFTFYMYNTAAATVRNNSSEPHVQRVMPSGMDEGAPAVLGTVAFWSHSVLSGKTTSVIEAAVLDVTVVIFDPLQQQQHVLAQMTGQRKEQHGAYCFSEICTSPGACSHAAFNLSWTEPVLPKEAEGDRRSSEGCIDV
jgi:hypothetical protein